MSGIWSPHPGPQTEFCERGEFEILMGGAAGPGKTQCLVMMALRYIVFSDYKGLILRRTFPQLQEIIDRCWEWYPRFGGVYRATEHRWYFESGATINLGHMQHEADKYNYQGKEYHFIGFDELTHFTESQYTYLFSRTRSVNPQIKPMVRSTTNPGNIGHYWVKERFVKIVEPNKTYFFHVGGSKGKVTLLSRAFIPGTVYDNPTLCDNDPDYVARLQLLPETEKKRLLYGDWDAFEGQVFPELSENVHMCEPFDIPVEWYRFMSFDWGYSNPFSCGWYAVDFNGIIYRYKEWYGAKVDPSNNNRFVGLKLSNQDIAQGILDKEEIYENIKVRVADPSIWNKTPLKGGGQGPSIFQDMVKNGVIFIKADNDRMQGKMQIHQRLLQDEDKVDDNGVVLSYKPRFQVFNTCEHFWRIFPNLQEAQQNKGKKRVNKYAEDVDTDQEDHIYDEVRYACMHRPIIPKRVERKSVGTFQEERRRLIRARRYSQTHGVSMSAAYNRIR